MRTLFVSLMLLSLQYKTRNGSWKHAVISFHEPRENLEFLPKCHLEHQWVGKDTLYTMTCVECSGVFHATVYYRQQPVGAALMDTCEPFHVILSITVRAIQPGGTDVDIEYRTKRGECVRVNYQSANKRYTSQEKECLPAQKQTTDDLSKGIVNGWSKKNIPYERGVVREVNEIYKDSKRWCKEMETWIYKDHSLVMECFECAEEYVAVVYSKKIPVGSATVETCKSPYVEWSITVELKKADNSIKIQYQTNTSKCIRKMYHLISGTFQEKEMPQCMNISKFSLNPLFGYRNGWKKRIQKNSKKM